MNDKKVAIVDDEDVVRQVLKAMVEDCGYTVVAEGSSGLDAVEICASGGVDLLIMDIDMPQMDGIEAARRIKSSSPVPILLVTGCYDHDMIKNAIEAGVTTYLVKPVRFEDLEPAVEFTFSHALECKELREQVDELKGTLASRQVIEKAKGLLMEHNGIGEAEAFARIRKTSMDKRMRMTEVADAIILTLAKA
ncbi:MAG: response regulator [Proteobacteria bacterium]|nr:response regulator [Pseudomonadota bacterium]